MYFNSVFTEDDANDFSETSKGPIFNVNLRLLQIFNGILNEELFNEINKDIVKYKNLFKLLSSKLPVKNYENSPLKTMTTRGKKKKQEQMKNSNLHKNVGYLNRNTPVEPPMKRSQGRPRKNVRTDFKNTPSQTKRKSGRPRKQIIEDKLPETYTKKPSQIELGSDSDSGADSDPEYLDYLNEIQAKNKREKNGKKPEQFIIPQKEGSREYSSTSEDEVIDIKAENEVINIETEDEGNSENSCIEEIF